MFAKKPVRVKQPKQVMEQTLFHYEVTGAKVKSEEDNSNDLIAMFIAAKRIEGCSEKTLMCLPLRHGDLRRWACHRHRLGHLLRRDADALFQPQEYAPPDKARASALKLHEIASTGFSTFFIDVAMGILTVLCVQRRAGGAAMKKYTAALPE